MIPKRLKRTLILSFIALLIGAGIGYFEIQGETANVQNKGSKPSHVAGIEIGGPFSLIDHNAKTVTQQDYADQYKLIYFGFTYCPAICPTELQKITQVLKTLGGKADNIQPLFITIDPQRDTVPVMQAYVDLFHPRLIGLTGNDEQIKNVLKSYRIFARKVQDPDMNDYTMDHSSFIYFMAPDNTLISLYRIQDKADYITKDIQANLNKN